MIQSEVAPLRRVLLKHASDAFQGPERIDEQWRGLGYTAAPHYDAACRESDALGELLETLGARVEWMPAQDVGLDSIYVRDAGVVVGRGAVLSRMGKPARAGEPAALRQALAGVSVPVIGAIEGEGTLEGGDVVWLARDLLAVGRGYRTNQEGIEQLRRLVGGDVEIIEVPLPHWRGPSEVLHLMSVLSPLAEDLLLVYSPLLPVPFRELLLERSFHLLEVPDEELDLLACNVLVVEPGVVVALDGAAGTRRRMEAAGVDVHAYAGGEISAKGSGGPTCLARPLVRTG